MRAATAKLWCGVHTWTSLVCTVFLLMLCATGLPLIFYEEIEHLTGRHAEPDDLPAGLPPADLDRIAAAGLAARPGEVLQYLGYDDHEPLVYVTTGPAADAPPDQSSFQLYDARSGEKIEAPPFDEGFMWSLCKLHTDLFAGLPGMLFLGVMGLLFVLSILSGVVVYGPFMRKLEFGTVRRHRSRRIRWLDLITIAVLGSGLYLWLARREGLGPGSAAS